MNVQLFKKYLFFNKMGYRKETMANMFFILEKMTKIR